MLETYILVDKKPVIEPDVIKWAEWMDDLQKRRVAEDYIGDYRVSTVFLGLNHGIGQKAPMLFETMIFGLPEDEDYCVRSQIWEEAEFDHKMAIEWVKRRLLENADGE